MKFILMAAGVGSRISKSINKPKCTLDVGGVPLIRRNVALLTEMGHEVAVVLGYMRDDVRAALEGLPVEFYVNPFYRVTNSIVSLWFAQSFFGNEDVILGNADVYWDEGMMDLLMESRSDAVMLADETRAKYGDFFFKVADGRVADYGKNLPESDRDTEYVGFAKISASFAGTFKERLNELIDSEKHSLWWENVLYEYLDRTPVDVIDVSDYFWSEIDYIDDYYRIQKYLETGDISCKYS